MEQNPNTPIGKGGSFVFYLKSVCLVQYIDII